MELYQALQIGNRLQPAGWISQSRFDKVYLVTSRLFKWYVSIYKLVTKCTSNNKTKSIQFN